MISSVEKFNALNGVAVTKSKLQQLLKCAIQEEQYHVVERLKKALEGLKKGEKVEIELSNKAVEVVPESFMSCLDCMPEQEGQEQLGKAVTPDQIYQNMTDKMISLIEGSNASDYKKEWEAEGYSIPFNFISKKRYRGINFILLTSFGLMKNPFFLTFNQIEKAKAKLKKGSKGYRVIHFNKLYRYANTNVEIASYDKNKFISELEKNRKHIPELSANIPASKIANRFTIPILKYYNVFNGDDIEGIDFDLDNFKTGYVEKERPALEENRNAIAEAIISNYPEPAPTIDFGGDRAFYSSNKDHVQLPFYKDFQTSQGYYSTAFHEFAHSTGHHSRLNRLVGGGMRSKAYAFEELIAEFTATFLSAEAGIMWHNNKNHAAYLKGWNRALVHLKKDNRFLMRAASEAQKAADFVLQFDLLGEPKYMKGLKKELDKKEKSAKKASKPVKNKIITKKKQIKQKKEKFVDITDFVLNDLPDKYEVRVYNRNENQLEAYAEGDDIQLANAAKNMLFLLREGLFVFEVFKKGYRRDSEKYVHRNIPIVYRRLKAIELNPLKPDVLSFLLDKYKEYNYEMAWRGDSFKGQTAIEIHSFVKYNIGLLERKLNPKKKRNTLADKKKEALAGTIESKTPISVPEVPETVFQKPISVPPNPENVIEQPTQQPISKPANSKAKPIGASTSDKPSVFFPIAGETAKFLQRVEKKPVHSVVVTLDGEKGGGKTTVLYQWMNDFALPGNKCLFISGEQHPDSTLAIEKAEKYISPIVRQRGNLQELDVPETLQDFYNEIAPYDIIFIDSWQKLQDVYGNSIRMDRDLRKKVHGKVFVIIFQQRKDGQTKGGSDVGYDGDIILKLVKEQKFEDNYVWQDKNRYSLVPIHTLRYNVVKAETYIYNEDEPTAEPEIETEETALQETNDVPLNFSVI